ncbi:enoyl-CoA hydratase/isomerase family protein [Dactylosporangium sp. AC04546]|uniref:enoyl-CoA hydratase/isomerase family protein n=1 Tax=Dactylosporangium sp. AC04546 TaxID=2862460 RepID=UPI001EE04F99|nr:enoyl-CoA hydratase/isomerase family protein [Dactylosporangium sp. AC04546]WVK86862.1 enoyl-CoA hydratase/isomerase family protein [Dactylosporangium sp. AC04546]
MSQHAITATQSDGVGTIRFNRPERRNALSLELFGALGDHLDRWRRDDSVTAVVLTGGEETFCAGLDLDLQSGFTPESRAAYAEACLRVYGTLLDYPKPTIAACAGPTLGGGCDIAVFCDIRIGAENGIFGFPQVKFGLTPYFSPLWKIVGLSQAKLLTLSGELIDAAEALRIGLVDRLVPAGQVVEQATRLARSIAETTTKSAMFNKEMMLRSPAMDPISALSFETMAYREIVWHPDVVERISGAYKRIRSRS